MANAEALDELLDQLPVDGWRQLHPFSADMEPCQSRLFDPTTSRREKADALLEWLGSKAQPCLFGRMAAKKGWLSVCVLTEGDVAKGDDHVRQTIQEHRRTWKEEALSGGKHGFIILAASKRLAEAGPGPVLQQMALRLCHLYLSETGLNAILHDSLDLRVEREGEVRFRRWKVGVNLFAAQGDGRWWHDHRIPGGIAFSMNSVGHMARKLAEDAVALDPPLARRAADLSREQLERWALPLAMRTIHTASRGRIPGTWLLERDPGAAGPPEVEERRRAALAGISTYNEDVYKGKYHTDQTIPAEYFDPAPDRPAGLSDHDLYFTYLHRPADQDFESMGLGEEILRILELGEAVEPGART
jgi:hypothetical protein